MRPRTGVSPTPEARAEACGVVIHGPQMGPANERLLRLMVLAGDVVGEYPLAEMATQEPRKTRLRAAHDEHGWRLAAA